MNTFYFTAIPVKKKNRECMTFAGMHHLTCASLLITYLSLPYLSAPHTWG